MQLIKMFLKKSKCNADRQGLNKKKKILKIKYPMLAD